jgi:hypothetical protein
LSPLLSGGGGESPVAGDRSRPCRGPV